MSKSLFVEHLTPDLDLVRRRSISKYINSLKTLPVPLEQVERTFASRTPDYLRPPGNQRDSPINIRGTLSTLDHF